MKSHNAGKAGKILNGLDFPMPLMGHYPTSFATDVEAFNCTVDMPLCSRDIPYPASSMKWGLAGIEGAYHLWHIDCDGFCTVINVQTGLKWWVVGHPFPGHDFSRISEYLQNYDVDAVNDQKWKNEGILLIPGSTL